MKSNKKYAITIMNIISSNPNLEFALNEDLELYLVESEEEALEVLNVEYSSRYVLYGLIPDPTKAFNKLKSNRLKNAN